MNDLENAKVLHQRISQHTSVSSASPHHLLMNNPSCLIVSINETSNLNTHNFFTPPPNSSFSCINFESCFHFSSSYINTLGIYLQALNETGAIQIIGTPFFRKKEFGVAWIDRLHKELSTDGYPLAEFMSFENFLTPKWLDNLCPIFDLEWSVQVLNKKGWGRLSRPTTHLDTIISLKRKSLP